MWFIHCGVLSYYAIYQLQVILLLIVNIFVSCVSDYGKRVLSHLDQADLGAGKRLLRVSIITLPVGPIIPLYTLKATYISDVLFTVL